MINAENKFTKAVVLTAKMNDARNTVRRILGDKYKAEMRDYQNYIRAAMAKHECSELTAALKLIGLLDAKDVGDGFARIVILSAAVEMISPSV